MQYQVCCDRGPTISVIPKLMEYDMAVDSGPVCVKCGTNSSCYRYASFMGFRSMMDASAEVAFVVSPHATIALATLVL